MSKRLEMLEKLVALGKADSFTRYALALEYRTLGRIDDAIRVFEALREADAAYLPMYLMAGQTLTVAGRSAKAAEWLEQGIALARSRGDSKTLGELEAALEAARI